MNFELIDSIEQFNELKKGDMILVRWSEYYTDHTQGSKEVMVYRIAEMKHRCNEVICQMRNNHYFNYKMYLKKKSTALEVYKVLIK